MPLLGLGGALAIGVSLGLLGSGGSIITVPVLVYLFGQAEKEAIAGSLVVVGVVASFGALVHARAGALVPRVALVFAPTGMAGAWLGATASQFVSGRVQLVTFAVTMLAAAALMLRPPAGLKDPSGGDTAAARGSAPVLRLLLAGALVGLLTGFVGVGGGFLIVPALVLGAGLPMHRAVGTSLVLIAVNAFAGFARHLSLLKQAGLHLDGKLLLIVALVGIAGSYLGFQFGARLATGTLRRAFGGALVVLAGFMLWQTSVA